MMMISEIGPDWFSVTSLYNISIIGLSKISIFKLNIHFKIILIVVCIKILASRIFRLHLYNLHVSYSVVLDLRTWGWDIEYLHLIVHHDLDKYIYVLISFLFVLPFRFVIDITLLWVPTGFSLFFVTHMYNFMSTNPLYITCI